MCFVINRLSYEAEHEIFCKFQSVETTLFAETDYLQDSCLSRDISFLLQARQFCVSLQCLDKLCSNYLLVSLDLLLPLDALALHLVLHHFQRTLHQILLSQEQAPLLLVHMLSDSHQARHQK